MCQDSKRAAHGGSKAVNLHQAGPAGRGIRRRVRPADKALHQYHRQRAMRDITEPSEVPCRAKASVIPLNEDSHPVTPLCVQRLGADSLLCQHVSLPSASEQVC